MNRIIFLLIVVFISVLSGCGIKSKVAPILVLASDAGFGTYTGEILKAEGWNEFKLDSLTDPKISATYLNKFDLVIVAESKVSLVEKEMLCTYVKKGGNLISLRPGPALTELFGVTPAGGNLKEGYIIINPDAEEGRQLTNKHIRFHGQADLYKVNTGRAIAVLCNDPVTASESPAVVVNDYGRGHALAFLYNLPESIVYTRQGNPLSAGIEKDNIPGLRGMDLFTDGWVDTDNSTINQADEQMVLFSHCIEKMISYLKPVPHLWYFPDTLNCLVTLTNDGEYRGENDFEPQFHDVDSLGARMSIYILDVNKVSKDWVDKWTARGHEISGHPDDTREAGNPTWNNMDSVIKAKKAEIDGKYGLSMHTIVNHWFVWCGRDADGRQDFAAEARLEEKNGIELDMNYAKYDIKSNQGEFFLGPPGINHGNFTGSGMVMKFADIKGHIINVYQHLNAVYDQEYNESHDPEGFYNCFKGLVDRSLHNEVYSFVSIKSHNDEYSFSKAPLMKMLAYAKNNGIPVWTALKLLEFIKMRDQATFENIRWSGHRLSFNLNSSLKHSSGLTFMVPSKFQDKKIKEITQNGIDASFTERSVRGSEYAFLSVMPGVNYSIIVNYGD